MTNSTVTPIRKPGPFESAVAATITKLQAVKAPRAISVFPHPSEFSTVADFMREVGEILNEMYSAIGHEIADNSPCRVDIDQFRSPCTDALDGALWECERASEALIEEHDEMMRARR